MEAFEAKKQIILSELNALGRHYDTCLCGLHGENKQLREWVAVLTEKTESLRSEGSLRSDVTKLGLLANGAQTASNGNQQKLITPRSELWNEPRSPDIPAETEARSLLGSRVWKREGVSSSQPHARTPRIAPLLAADSQIEPELSLAEEVDFNSVHHRWEILYDGIHQLPYLKPSSARVVLELRSAWVMSANDHEKALPRRIMSRDFTYSSEAATRSVVSCTDMRVSCLTTNPDTLRAGEVRREQTWLQAFMYHPDGAFANLRTLLGAMLILYDIVVFPMIAFNIGESDTAAVMSWVTACFWAIDLPLNFFQGFHSCGIVDMRPAKVVRNYFKGWFACDLFITVVDWFFLILGELSSSKNTGSDDTGALRAVRAMRSSRMLRAARSLRFIKFSRNIKRLLDEILSESMYVMAKLVVIVFTMLLICHYIACVWYAIAHWNGGQTWITTYHLHDDSDFAKYATALHWTITQFTPATNNVAPANSGERLFAVVTVFVALVVFSNFASSITNATTQIRKIKADCFAEEQQIRLFMHSREVPLGITNRIWHFYRQHYRVREKKSTFASVPFFASLPSSLGTDLRTHLFLPTLQQHPIFVLCLQRRHNFNSICTAAISEQHLSKGGEVFCQGDAGIRMYFVKSGLLTYDCQFYDKIFTLSDGVVAEAALWGRWTHCGLLSVDKPCELVSVHASSFEHCVVHQHEFVADLRSLQLYASLFAQFVTDSVDSETPITDILGKPYEEKWKRIQHFADRARVASTKALGPTEQERRHSFATLAVSLATLSRSETSKSRDMFSIVDADL